MSIISDTKRLDFLQYSLEPILRDDLNFSNIIKLSKAQKIKGLTSAIIRKTLKLKGFEYDDIKSKKWLLTAISQDNSSHDLANSEQNNDESNKQTNNLLDLPEKITNQEPLRKEIVEPTLGLTSEIQTITENTLRVYTPDTSTIVQEVLRLSSSKGKRYDLTLSEDLVNKAIEKLVSKHKLVTQDLIKPSKLFETLLFDYIYSSK